MKNLFVLLRSSFKIALSVILGGYFLFLMLALFGEYGTAQSVGGILGTVIFIAVFGGLIAGLIFAVFIGNRTAARVLGVILFAYIGMRIVFAVPEMVSSFGSANGLVVTYAVFGLLASLAFFGSIGLFLAGLFVPAIRKIEVLKLVASILILSYVGCAVLSTLFLFIAYCANGVPWYSIMAAIAQFFLIGGVFYGYLMLVENDVSEE